jgi:hypothetical protein
MSRRSAAWVSSLIAVGSSVSIAATHGDGLLPSGGGGWRCRSPLALRAGGEGG